MRKELSFLTLGLIMLAISLPCDAAKLSKAQMEEIYNNGNTSSTVSATGATSQTKVSTQRVIKPNVSVKTAPSASPQPKQEAKVAPIIKPEPAPQAKCVVAKPKSEQADVQKTVQKPQNLKASKNKKQSDKSVKTENKTTNSSWKVKVAQRNLRILGFSSEASTGKITATTKEALTAFQKKYKLTAKGELNNETYDKLNWEAFAKTGIKNIKGSDVVAKAAKYKGVPYVFGGTTPKGFDCSGYVQYVFRELGGKLTRTADMQAEEGIFITQKNLKPGDLVFFTTYEPGASHVGIYAGNGQFWNASSSRGVVLYKLSDDYWRTRYYGARRVLVSNGEIH